MQMSILSSCTVARVANSLPHAHRTVQVWYLGWIPFFMARSGSGLGKQPSIARNRASGNLEPLAKNPSSGPRPNEDTPGNVR